MANLREKQMAAIRTMLNLNHTVSSQLTSLGEPQWKVLVYDEHAQDVISPLLSVRELRDAGVTLHMPLKVYREQIDEAPIVYFVQATPENIKLICDDFNRKLYESYYINFTGSVPRPLLEELASGAVRANCANSIAKIFDQYLDFISVEEDLFVLKTLEHSPFSFYSLHRPDVKDAEMDPMIKRVADGLFSVLATLGRVPIIRTPRNNAADLVGQILDRRIRDCLKDSRNTLFTGDPLAIGGSGSGGGSTRPLLIIVDRSIDLATLLHHTWTYQALVHDVLNMKLNKVEMAVDSGAQGKRNMKSYALNSSDSVWAAHKTSPFPKVAEAVQEALDLYKNQEGEVRRLKAQLGLDHGGAQTTEEEDAAAIASLSHTSSVQSLSSAVSSLPDLLEKKRLIDMHTNLATALLDAIKTRQLDEFFETEERILAQQGSSTSLQSMTVGDRPFLEALASPLFGSPTDRQRLALIWLLCSSDMANDFEKLSQSLSQSGVDSEALRYVKQWRALENSAASLASSSSGGGGTRTISMFSNLLSTGSQFVMSGVKNFVVKQRRLALTRIVEALADPPRLSTAGVTISNNQQLDAEYRYFDPKTLRAGSETTPRLRGPFSDVFVFVVGGGNYIEYANLVETNRAGARRIVYGCTELVAPQQFLQQLEQLGAASMS